MTKKILIIGKGSIGLKHKYILNRINKKFKIFLLQSRSFKDNKKTNNYLKKFNPDYIIIASPCSEHFKHFKIIETIFSNKSVLIEKPLFNYNYPIPKKLKNRYFVGYNLRYDPVIRFIKKFILKKKFFHINILCSSYLPSWRKNINYKDSVSAQKKLGGGALLELSHEIDYLLWILGGLKIINPVSSKISNLNINTDDIFLLQGRYKKVLINLSLNFFSKIKKREIIIDGNQFSIFGDLRNGKIILYNKNKKKTKNFSKNKIDQSIKLQHLAILSNKKKNNLCSITQAKKVLDIISRSR